MQKVDFSLFAPPEKKEEPAGLLAGSMKERLSDSWKLKSVLKLIEPDATVIWSSDGHWSMHELLLSLLNITGAAEVYISSYAMSETAARVLANLKHDGMIQKLYCVLDNRVDVRSPGSLQLITSICDKLSLIKTHAKVTILKNANWTLTVIGSANYTENVRMEAGTIFTSPEPCQMQIDWITKALNNDGHNN